MGHFTANHCHKAVEKALALAKECSTAESLMARSKKMTVQLLEEAKDGECVMGCVRQWFEAALQVLAN